MKVSVDRTPAAEVRCDLLAVPVEGLDASKPALPARLRALDRQLGGALASALASGDFTGKKAQTALIYPAAASGVKRVLLLGLGPAADVEAESLRRAAGRTVGAAMARKAGRVALVVPTLRRIPADRCAQALAEGATLGAYRFDTYKGKSKGDRGGSAPRSFKLVFGTLRSPGPVRKAVARGQELAECQNVARRLSNEPPNILSPVAVAREARKVSSEVGLRCRVLDVPALKRAGMGALLSVGQGSDNPPRLIVMEHNPPKKGARRRPTVCVVGKGITFDSGGISIKPAPGMETMKHDMSGAAAVVGIMRSVALRKLPLHVVGVIAAAENMPGGRAYRPSDIVRSMSGKTIEILNTDAEGRVVLADALHYAKTEFEPEAIVDLATLTGACIVALGPYATGVFTEDEDLAARLSRAGDATGERAWAMPLLDEHKRAMRSQVADLKNTGGRDAGASLAAGFLSAFVGDARWAHLDIAGTADTAKPGPYQPVGATGVGVRLVSELLEHWQDD
ncbi:MAG: leucyl aminopeptidase [Myxococcota bacterium]